jgi:hypothetical protein
VKHEHHQFTGNLLALDLASVTGWATGAPGEVPKFGTIRFARQGAPHPAIYRALRSWLNGWINAKSIQMVVYESAAMPTMMLGRSNARTIRLLTGLCEHVEELCYERIELREASTSQVRSHFIGTNRNKRTLAKELTIERCREMGWPVEDDNQADACALWSLMVCILRPDVAPLHSPLLRRRRIVNDIY